MRFLTTLAGALSMMLAARRGQGQSCRGTKRRVVRKEIPAFCRVSSHLAVSVSLHFLFLFCLRRLELLTSRFSPTGFLFQSFRPYYAKIRPMQLPE